MPRINSDVSRPLPDPLSKAFFAADFERIEQAHRTVHLADLPIKTQQAVRQFVEGTVTTTEPAGETDWSEEDIVLLHWGLLRELRRLPCPETPLEEKLDTLAWALTEPELDDRPFSFANCLKVVANSPLSPTPYCGRIQVEEVRQWLRHNARRWIAESLERYPQWVQELIRQQPDHVANELDKNPQWLNEQVKKHAASEQLTLFSQPALLLAA
jgi:hypothetical protein